MCFGRGRNAVEPGRNRQQQSKDPMSRDVEQCLLEIFQQQGRLDEAAAQQKLEQLKKEGRYAKDVY